MSQYYKPNRNSNWNYGGGRWRLSRSKIELFVECPRCFYVDNKLGTARPRGPAFTINIAVDTLFKKEFDIHRANKTAHPLMKAYNIDAVPFAHEDIDIWRENFKGLECKHEPTGFRISGALDDVWQDRKGKLIVVDYKATSKEGKIESLEDSSWKAQYKRQIGIYQWLLEQMGHDVSTTGYFVYANALSNKEAFDGQLEFDVTLVPCEGDTKWIEGTLSEIKKCLDSDMFPEPGAECDYCAYRGAAGRALLKVKMEHKKEKQSDKEHPQKNTETLF